MSQPGVRALALILCLAACDAGAKPEPAAAPSPKPVLAIKQQPAIAASFNLAYLPADSDIVMHADVAALRKSKLWSTYAQDVAKMIAPGVSVCAGDLMSQVSSVDIGVAVGSQPNVFVVRGLARDQALACLRGLKSDGAPAAVFDGDFVTLTGTGGRTRVLTFVDDHTLVMQSAKPPATPPTKQTLQQVLQIGAPLAQSPSFVAATARAKTTAALSAVSRPGSEPLATQLKQTGVQFSSLWGSIDLTDKLELRYAMDVENADQATQVATMMKTQLGSPQVKQMFDRIEAHAQDKTVTLELAMSDSKLANMAGMLRGLLPES